MSYKGCHAHGVSHTPGRSDATDRTGTFVRPARRVGASVLALTTDTRNEEMAAETEWLLVFMDERDCSLTDRYSPFGMARMANILLPYAIHIGCMSSVRQPPRQPPRHAKLVHKSLSILGVVRGTLGMHPERRLPSRCHALGGDAGGLRGSFSVARPD